MTTIPIQDDEETAAVEPALAETGREYVVLQGYEGTWTDSHWIELGSYPAISSDEAIKKAAAVLAMDPEIDTSDALTYVAVPARSFKPVEVTARVEPKIEFKGR